MKIFIKILLGLIFTSIVLIIGDFCVSYSKNEVPYISVRKNIKNKYYLYNAFFYRVLSCNGENYLLSYNDKYKCTNTNIKLDTGIEIISDNKACNSMLESFHKDEEYTYYFDCIRSSFTYVSIHGEKKILVKTAIKNGLVTIEELREAGLIIYQQKNGTDEVTLG